MDNLIKSQIEKIGEKCKEIKPLVAIRCITYNHEKYIRDALEGFMMQQTNFAYVVIVHDDYSTDKTQSIIKEYCQQYPNKILPIFETENLFSKGREFLLQVMNEAISETGAKYIALCEGDDYWIDPYKLQKQVDYMESHPECGLCYTSFNIKDEIRGKIRVDLFKNEPEIFPGEYKSVEEFILKQGYVCPPSWLMRASLWNIDLPVYIDATFVWFADFMSKSKVQMLPDVTCVYRVIAESASHSNNYDKMFIRQKNLLKTQIMLIDQFGLPESLKDVCRKTYYKRFLKSFIINSKREEVRIAKAELDQFTPVERILLFINYLRLNKLLKGIQNIKLQLKR